MPNVVILETVRGGRDPDQYYHVLTVGLADELDGFDPWSDLADLEDAEDHRILVGYLSSEQDARQWCDDHGYMAEEEVFEAPGY